MTFLRSILILLTKYADNIKGLAVSFTKRFASKGNKRTENIWAIMGITSMCCLSSLPILAKSCSKIARKAPKVVNKTSSISTDIIKEALGNLDKIGTVAEELSKNQNDTKVSRSRNPQVFNQISHSRKERVSTLKQAQELTVTVGSWDEEEKKWVGRGSGFLVGRYLCITNVHVIAGHRKISVKPFDTQEWYPVGSRAKYDIDSHLVILRTKEDLSRLSFSLGNPYNSEYKLGYPVTIVGNQLKKPYFLRGYISEPFEGKLLAAIQNGRFRLIGIFLESMLDAWSDAYAKTGFIIKASLTNMQSGVPIINNAFKVEGVVVTDVSLLHFIPKSEGHYEQLLHARKAPYDSQLLDEFFPDRHDFVVPVVHLYRLLAEKKQWMRLPIFVDSVFE